jgi:hypothetical protein
MPTTKKKTEKKSEDPCWKNYEQVGTKKKEGKTVPNCVPEKTKKK